MDNFVPPLFVVYLEAAFLTAGWLGPVVFAPLGLYLLTVVAQTFVSMTTKGFVRSLLAMPLVIASHIFYGLGFWRGLFTTLKPAGQKPAVEVKLETISL